MFYYSFHLTGMKSSCEILIFIDLPKALTGQCMQYGCRFYLHVHVYWYLCELMKSKWFMFSKHQVA